MWYALAAVGLMLAFGADTRAETQGTGAMSAYYKKNGRCMYAPPVGAHYEMSCADWEQERKFEFAR